MNFELLNSIASWIGWMPVALVLLLAIIIGVWFYKERANLSNERIEGLKENLNRVEKELENCKNSSPDIVANRILKKHRLAQEALEELNIENENKEIEIDKLKIEIEETRREAKNYFSLLELAQSTLGDLATPRDGQLNSIIINNIYSKIINQGFIFIPFRTYSDNSEHEIAKIRNGNPYRLDLINPGMSQQYLFVFDKENNLIGEVINEYLHAYARDYHETLLKFLRLSETNSFTSYQPGGGEVSQSVLMKTSEFHDISPVDGNIFYIRVPMSEINSKLSFDELLLKLSEVH